VQAATVYTGAAKKLIWKLKSSGAQEAASIMASCMRQLAADRPAAVIVSIPTASTRVRQRGYDQAKLLGRELAKQAKLFWVDCLARQGQAHQVGSGREQRLLQLQGALRLTQKRFIRGAHVIIVDDVVTTGATLEAAANVLKVAGAQRIDALVFAKPTLQKG
jgi:ComF family protein